MLRHARALFVVAVSTLSLAACGGADLGPSAIMAPSASASQSAVKFWDANATANWTDIATSLTARQPVNVARMYVYLALAQLRAAEDASAIRPHPPTGAAIGAASAAVLKSYFPAAFYAEIDAALAAQSAAKPWPGAKFEDFAAGAAIGTAAAARVITYSAGDRAGLTNPGAPPTTPGSWLWSGGPIARGLLGARPFFLSATNELRSPPPPAFNSPEFLSALNEVRQIGLTRTAEQRAIALFWNVNQSPASNAAITNLAVELLRTHRRDDVESARILFQMNAAAFDALIGCFDAKYTYWYIRPNQADPTLNLVFNSPPHPSYPAAHSCVSGSTTGVLAAAFPSERERLAAFAEEASLSRMYAGIHFRFDVVAGLALGNAAAQKALAADLGAVAVQ